MFIHFHCRIPLGAQNWRVKIRIRNLIKLSSSNHQSIKPVSKCSNKYFALCRMISFSILPTKLTPNAWVATPLRSHTIYPSDYFNTLFLRHRAPAYATAAPPSDSSAWYWLLSSDPRDPSPPVGDPGRGQFRCGDIILTIIIILIS